MADPSIVRDAAAEDQSLGFEDADALARAVGTLAPDLQAAVRATYLDGLTVPEASALLGIPTGTIKTRVKRAKAQLEGALR